jgi:4-amino-4-deoxy-L-arabinose transferase-like glycosyltransferase
MNRPAALPLWLLAVTALLMLGAGLGLRDPWPADEPRFALIARDMLWFGDWLIPHRAGELYPDKPPLFMWAIAFFYWLTDSLRFAFLLPSLLSGFAILALVHDLGRRLWDARTALFGSVALLFTLQFADQARSAQIDIFVSFWTTLGLYGLLRHLLLGPAWGWYWVACTAMGLGVISKGVGFLPLLTLLPYGYARWRRWPGLPALGGSPFQWLLGGVLFLAAIAAWVAPMLWVTTHSNDPALLEYRNNILFQQTVNRYASLVGHEKPIWFYLLEVIPLYWLPLVLLLPWLIPAWRMRLRERDARSLLLLGYIALIVLFFTLSAGKRAVYVLPAVPAFALASAPFLDGLWRRAAVQRLGFAFTLGLSVLLLGLGAFLQLDPPAKLLEAAANLHGDFIPLLYALGAAGLLAALVTRPARGGWAVLLLFFSQWQIYGWWAYPLFNDARSGRGLMQEVALQVAADEVLAIVDFPEQLVLQAGRPVVHFGYHPQTGNHMLYAIDWLRKQRRGVLLVSRDELVKAPCFKGHAPIDVGQWHDERWVLVRPNALIEPLPDNCLETVPYRSWTTRVREPRKPPAGHAP